ncbi:MAG: excinuclease ABC subunit UvrC [Gammaproteobacteria bacterium]
MSRDAGTTVPEAKGEGVASAFDARLFLKNLTERPGVYRMLDAEGLILYVGKARNLRKRVSSYFRKELEHSKTRVLMKQVHGVEITITNTEAEALILEDTLIKTHRPRYNILLRDDKSYPYVKVSTEHDFPRVSFYRGSTKGSGRFFGPFPSAHAVRDSVNLLQKLFRLRPCEDTFFERRSRPCLQYQIKRCTAPCVGMIDRKAYSSDLDNAMLFLEGKSHQIVANLGERMEHAAQAQDYESAATYRDQIARLNKVAASQHVADSRRGDFDIIAGANDGAIHCVAVIYIRGGRNIGSRSYFPRVVGSTPAQDVLSAFIAQYYLARGAPAEILVSDALPDASWLGEALSDKAGRKVKVRANLRGERAAWLDMAKTNAAHALNLRRNSNSNILAQLEALQSALGLAELPERIECFDISHTGGDQTVGSCVVYTREGVRKSDYRRFNITDITPGDDYAAMDQVLKRRYTRVKRGESPVPDLLLVDGGKGQLTQAAEVMEELQLNQVLLLGIAKGPERRAGHEQLFLHGQKHPIILPSDSKALHLLMHIRDEAHRFAIAGHRARRAKRQVRSVLEEVAGLGPKRRRTLLRHFGGLDGVQNAPVEDLASVDGIGPMLAQTIYDHFH